MAKRTNVVALEQSKDESIYQRPASIIVHVFTLQSLSPLLMHNPAGMRLEQKAKSAAVKAIPSAEEEAAAGAYRLANGELYMPVDCFRTSLLKGCIGRRIGKTGAASVIGASVMPIELEAPLLDPATGAPLTEYEIDIRRAVVQRQGIRRARPMIRNWLVKLPLEVDTEFVTVGIVTELFNIAGRIAGVGNYRPNRGGIFGRYRAVVSE